MNEWIYGLCFCIMLVVFTIGYFRTLKNINKTYNDGYNDGFNDAVKTYVPSDDMEKILKILKEAYKDKIRQSDDRQRGDIKAINETSNINELKEVVWEQNVLRKEQKND